jgi:hypothetical protein
MKMSMSRRAMVAGSAVASIAGFAKRTEALALAAPATSAGLGLSRAEIESVYGAGVAGQSFMVYIDPVHGVDLHIGYDNDAVDYIWLSIGDEQTMTGLAMGQAGQLVMSLLPSDAQLQETYISQESPGSIAHLETTRYTSAWLGEILGRDSVLVTILSVPGGSGMDAVRGGMQVGRPQPQRE